MRNLCRLKGQNRIVAIANGAAEVQSAINAGCDAIEQGYGMGADQLKMMVDRNILWIPSVLRAKNRLDASGSGGDVCCRFSQRYVAPGGSLPGEEEFWRKTVEQQLDLLRRARELGVVTAVGTGAGNTGILHGESVIEELKLFMKSGFTLEESIASASQIGARFFGFDHLGALRVDGPATFLVARGSVKQFPRKLSFLERIYRDGVPLHCLGTSN